MKAYIIIAYTRSTYTITIYYVTLGGSYHNQKKIIQVHISDIQRPKSTHGMHNQHKNVVRAVLND